MNKRLKQYWTRSKQELDELTTSRILLQNSLRAGIDERLLEDRERREDIVRDQTSRLESIKKNHQFRCQDLCESVLDANSELNRLRQQQQQQQQQHNIAIESRSSSGTSVGYRRQRRKSSSALWMMLVVLAAVIAILLVALLVSGGGERKLTTDVSCSVPIEY